MNKLYKINFLLGLVSFFYIAGFVGSCIAASIGTMQIIPEGKVYVYRGDQKIAELTAESPIPQGKTLKVEGKCGVKMGSLYLVATDKSAFTVWMEKRGQKILVKEGKIFFGITDMPGPITFFTPKGGVVAQQLMLKTSSQSSILEGYIDVSKTEAEIGVTSGGSMVISTADGELTINEGKRFLLAQAQVPIKEGAAKEGAAGALKAAGATATSQLAGGTISDAAVVLSTLSATIIVGNISAHSSSNGTKFVSPKQ